MNVAILTKDGDFVVSFRSFLLLTTATDTD